MPVLAIALLIALSGCGSGGTKTVTVAAPPAVTSGATTPSGPTAGEEKSTAQAMLLRLRDFPSGWTLSESGDVKQVDCPAITQARGAAAARANTGDFDHGDDESARHVVYLYSDTDGAQAAYESLTSDETRRCIGDYLADELDKQSSDDAKYGDSTVSQLNVTPAGADAYAIRLVIPVSAAGFETEVDVDIVMLRRQRAVSLLTLISSGSAFDDALRDELMGTSLARISDALND